MHNEKKRYRGGYKPYQGYVDCKTVESGKIFLRSYAEFIAYMRITYVDKHIILAAGTVSLNGNDGRRKIPDFIVLMRNYMGTGKTVLRILEIKPSDKEMVALIVDYATIGGFGIEGVDYEFWSLTSTRIKANIKDIVNAIGQEEFDRQRDLFMKQRGDVKVEGFFGEANPMWGKKHSDKTKKLLSEISSKNTKGELNPMFGKTHTEEAKVKIAAKWSNDENKIRMLRKGMVNHYFNFNSEQKELCNKYFQMRLAGEYCKPPEFLNRCYYISSVEKIEKWFGSIENFWGAIQGAISS